MLYDIIYKKYKVWKSNFWLGRTVGGIYPVIKNAQKEEYKYIVYNSNNKHAIEAFEFHREIQTKRNVALKLVNYARSENFTYPNKIIHPKVIIIKSIYENKDMKNEVEQILNIHKYLTKDAYYKKWFQN